MLRWFGPTERMEEDRLVKKIVGSDVRLREKDHRE